MELNISNKKIVIDGSHFFDLNGFYEEISEKLMKNEEWKVGTLDGLNDVLYGVPENFNPNGKVEIVWKNSEKSKEDLGFKSTLDFLENKLKIGKPYNLTLISQQKEDLIAGKGQTLFEIILEIFSEHQNILLELD